MDMLKVKITVKNVVTGETGALVLPDPKFDTVYNELTHGGIYTLTVDQVKANFDFVQSRYFSIRALNNLLSEVNALDDFGREKVMDLYQIEEHTQYGLLIAYSNHKHYEVVNKERAWCNDFNELKRRAGAIYMLGICPDLVVAGESVGLLTDEYRDAMFREGIRSKGIYLIGDKFYIKDTELLETATDEDIDYYEREERLYAEENHK